MPLTGPSITTPPLPPTETERNLAALKEGYEALKDIINAADNEQPYSREELDRLFQDATGKLFEAIIAVEPGYEGYDQLDTSQEPTVDVRDDGTPIPGTEEPPIANHPDPQDRR